MVDERVVLDFYLEQMDLGKISFLEGNDDYSHTIREQIVALRESNEMHDKILIAKDLWKTLFEASLVHIDHDKNGYDQLFEFFDEYVEFEELIFASDAFYRDHTIHCLWVYFLGEYLYRKPEYKFIFKNMFEENESFNLIYQDIRKLSKPELFGNTLHILSEMYKMTKFEDSIRCLVALTHDLGYPLKKIKKINSCISKILPRFSIESFNEFDFSFSNTQMRFINEFIEYISMDLMINIDDSNEVNKELIARMFRSDEKGHPTGGLNIEEIEKFTDEEIQYVRKAFSCKVGLRLDKSKSLRYSSDFEKYEHGILSAFLLMKTLGFFRDINFKYFNADNISPADMDLCKVISATQILSAVANHTSVGYQINSIGNVSSLLMFVDELEEFSRITRANKNREYINEFCKTDIYVEDNTFNVDFIFDNSKVENLDPQKAFIGRCKKLLKLFNVKDLDKAFRLRLRCLGRLHNDSNVYCIEIRRKYANITINGENMDIPSYLNSREFFTKDQYTKL